MLLSPVQVAKKGERRWIDNRVSSLAENLLQRSSTSRETEGILTKLHAKGSPDAKLVTEVLR
jgi:hypothetical protein